MKIIKIELNDDGVQELLKSPEIVKECETYAQNAVKQLGAGFSSDTRLGRYRAHISVHADTVRAKRSNAKHNSILKAVFNK